MTDSCGAICIKVHYVNAHKAKRYQALVPLNWSYLKKTPAQAIIKHFCINKHAPSTVMRVLLNVSDVQNIFHFN